MHAGDLVPVPEFGPLDVLALRAHQVFLDGRADEAVRACRDALVVARGTGDASTCRYLLYVAGLALLERGRHREAVTTALDLLDAVGPHDVSWRAKALALLAAASAHVGELGRALDALAEAQSLVEAQDGGNGQLEMSARMAVGQALRGLTLYEHAEEVFAELLRAGDGSDPDNETLDRMQAALLQVHWGAALEAAELDGDAAAHFALSATRAVWMRRTAQQQGLAELAARAEVIEAYALARLGGVALAGARVSAALPRFTARPSLVESQLAHLVLGESAAARGEHDLARTHLSQAEDEAQRTGRTVWSVAAVRALAAVDVAEHGPHPAVDRWRQLAGDVVRQAWLDRGSRFAALRQRHQLREMAAATDASTRAAHEDPLTGLGNRRQLSAGVDDSCGAVSVVFVDVDRFKVVNDRFSHTAGDEVLRRVAVLLRGQCRGDDLVVRYGGDEFVILVRADEDAAEDIAARVHHAVHHAPWHEVALGLRVTVSIGVAHAPDAGAAMAAADAAMLAAKRAGRDRVVPA